MKLVFRWNCYSNASTEQDVYYRLKCFAKEEWNNARYYIRSSSSICGSILFWLGCWNLLTERFSSRLTDADDTEGFTLFDASGAREISYTFVGFTLLLLTDTLYGNAGLRGGFYPPKAALFSKWFTVVRCSLGLFGSVLFWTGTYDWLDVYTWDASIQRELCYTAAGLVTLFLTGTFLVMAYVYPPKGVDHPKVVADFHSSLQRHFAVTVRCTISILGQNMIWLGVWNALEYYIAPSIWRETFYCVLGLFLFVATNNFDLPHEMEEGEDEEDPKSAKDGYETVSPRDSFTYFVDDYSDVRTFSVAFGLRSIIALLGQVILTVGIWSLLDQYILPQSQLRNILVAVTGLFLLIISGMLLQSAAITPLVAAFWQPDLPYDLSGPCKDAFPSDTSTLSDRLPVPPTPRTPAKGSTSRTLTAPLMFSRPLWSSPRARFHSEVHHESLSESPPVDEAAPLLSSSPINNFKARRQLLRESNLRQRSACTAAPAHVAASDAMEPTAHDPLLAPEDNDGVVVM